MPSHQYSLGSAALLEQLYPAPELAFPQLNFKTYEDVISHYTASSLKADGIRDVANIQVTKSNDEYFVKLEGSTGENVLTTFGERHAKIFSKDFAAKSIRGMELLKELGVWNPMENYKVNKNVNDGTSKWHLFPPLGLNVMGQKGLLLMHYPPWSCLQLATFDGAITMNRWEQLLICAGIPKTDVGFFKTIIDINPIAAPGSGESEYPNDYFPIMLASGFFDGPPERNYIRSMLELYLTPPGWPADRKYTLPLLICGSPLYDPQAPGWFRVAYKDIIPQDENGIPQVNVMQTGTFRISPDSPRETPYLISNHMIAAGVTGECTDHPDRIPNILQYEAQDMVSATFLKLYAENPDITPQEAKSQACERWYGNPNGNCAPYPKEEMDRRILCALAQQDLYFSPKPFPHPTYTFDEAMERCKTASQPDNPCFGNIKPPARTAE